MLGRFTLAMLLGLLLTQAGCGPSSTKLLGTWRLDGADKLQELMGGARRPGGMAGALLETAINAMGETSLEVEFLSNGTLESRFNMAGTKTEKSGSWKLISATGDTYQLWCQIGDEDPTEIEVTMIDADTMEMVPPNIAVLNRKFKFRRVKP